MSGDQALVAPAMERCEATFKARLTKRAQRACARAGKRCERRFARKEGAVYLSMIAFCKLKTAVRYAAPYGAKR